MRHMRGLAIGVLCWLASIGIANSAAAQTPGSVLIINTGASQLFIVPAGQTSWGENLLPDTFGSQGDIPLPQGQGCVFHVRAVDRDGRVEEAWNLNWCGQERPQVHAGCAGYNFCTLKRPTGPAPGAFRPVYIMNALDDFPREFYIAAAEDAAWGRAYPLNRDWTPTTFTLLGGYCVYHIKIVHKNGRISYYPNHNACTAQVFSIKGGGVSADPLPRAATPSAPARSPVEEKRIQDCLTGTDPKVVLEQCKMAIIGMANTDEVRPKIYAARGSANRRLGDYPEALKWMNEAIAANPRDAWSLNERGVTHAARNDWAAAVRDYDAALRLSPDDPTYLGNRALALMWLGEYDRAEADATRVISLAPQNASTHNRRGLVRRQRGDYREAIEDFSQAIARDQKNHTFFSNRGIGHLLAGNLSAALEDLNRAIELDGAYAYARFARAVLFARQGRQTDSDADLKAARAANASIDEDMKRRGVVMPAAPAGPDSSDRVARAQKLTREAHDAFDRGDLDAAAAAAYSALLAMGADVDAPVLSDAYNLEGVIRLRRGKFEAAANSFAMATMANGSQAVYWVNYAYALFRSGKEENVRSHLDKALSLDPRNVEALFMRAVVRHRQGDLTGSDADLKAARAVRPDVDAYMANLGITFPRAARLAP